MEPLIVEKRINRKMLAKMSKVSLVTIHKILVGERHAGRKTAERLEKVTGVEAPCWVWPERYNLKQRIKEVMGVEV